MLKKAFFRFISLCGFLILLMANNAFAADQTFENHDNDLMIYTTDLPLAVLDHGNCLKMYSTSSVYIGYVDFAYPFNDYLGFNIYFTKGSNAPYPRYGLKLIDSEGHVIIDDNDMAILPASNSGTWHRIEFKENAAGTGIEAYSDGVLLGSYVYTHSGTPVNCYVYVVGGWWYYSGSYQFTHTWVDAFTNSYSHAVIDMDDGATVTDLGQYYRLGVAPLSNGKYYQVKLFSPDNQVVYTKNFDNVTSSLLAEQLISVNNLSEVGEYTLHLYRVDSETSKIFLTMKSFAVTDPAATGEGSITLDKLEYEAGDNVDFWVHLKDYASGYKVRCEFAAGGGSNFRKEVDVTSDTFHSSFSIPDISNVIGSHTVFLLNPDGKVVDSEDFNVYVPGLPDIAFDKSTYERSDKALIYYKDVKDGSTLTVTLRYGGTNAQTLSYNIEGTGTVSIDLSILSAADSMLAVVKDSDGYSNDDDNAKIIVGDFILSGRVYDAKTGSVIPNATVTVQGKSINSDTDGNYNLSALAGFANYSVVADGYNSITGTVAVFDLETIHNFYLSPVITNGGTGVYGTVVSSKTDYPLVGASVEVTNTDNLKRYSTIVDSKGYYSVSHDDLAGNLSIRVSYNNYDSIVSNALVSSGAMQNHNYRLNAVPGYEEIDPSEHTGGQDSTDPGETAEERAYREKYGEMGKHPFDFNGDGTVENSEWKYAFERLGLLLGCLAFMGFMVIISRRR